MIVKGREVQFLYSVQASCDIDDLFEEKGVDTFGAFFEVERRDRAYAALGEILSRAYCDANGKGKPATKKEFLSMPAGDYADLIAEISEAISEGSKRTVLAKEDPGKNAESAVMSD